MHKIGLGFGQKSSVRMGFPFAGLALFLAICDFFRFLWPSFISFSRSLVSIERIARHRLCCVLAFGKCQDISSAFRCKTLAMRSVDQINMDR